jgi:hypothetical protein
MAITCLWAGAAWSSETAGTVVRIAKLIID